VELLTRPAEKDEARIVTQAWMTVATFVAEPFSVFLPSAGKNRCPQRGAHLRGSFAAKK
jgi:hypothetical protein